MFVLFERTPNKLTIHTGKNCFTQFSTRMAAWVLLTFFICLQNQLSFLDSIITHVLRVHMSEKNDYQIDSKKEWLLLSTSFTAKLGVTFVLALEIAFSWRFLFKANGKSIGSSKKR